MGGAWVTKKHESVTEQHGISQVVQKVKVHKFTQRVETLHIPVKSTHTHYYTGCGDIVHPTHFSTRKEANRESFRTKKK